MEEKTKWVPKAGDWVLLKGGGNGLGPNQTKIVQLLEIDESNHPTGHYDFESQFMWKDHYAYLRTRADHVVRPATPEEIAMVQSFKFNVGDIVEPNGKGREEGSKIPSMAPSVKGLEWEEGKVVGRVHNDGCNWYQLDFQDGKGTYGNWISEDGLDPVQKPAESPNTDLLEEAKRRYPVGTKVKCATHRSGPYIVNGDYLWQDGGTQIISSNRSCYVYDKNKGWAEIVSMSKVEVPNIPDYGEFIGTTGEIDWWSTNGKIYKFFDKNGDHLRWTMDNGSPNGGFWGACLSKKFKPSTKEAYDRQNSGYLSDQGGEGMYPFQQTTGTPNYVGRYLKAVWNPDLIHLPSAPRFESPKEVYQQRLNPRITGTLLPNDEIIGPRTYGWYDGLGTTTSRELSLLDKITSGLRGNSGQESYLQKPIIFSKKVKPSGLKIV